MDVISSQREPECLHTAGRLVRLAESFQDEANLLAQARFGIFAVLKALLDQNWMEERRECGVDCTRRFRGILKGYRHEVQVYSATKPSMASRQLAHPTS
jgi:hypothetical protein